jgi:hypothetical protein
VRGQPGQLDDQFVGRLDLGELAVPHPSGVGDDPSVLRVGLPLAPEHCGHTDLPDVIK